jgi:hypothetical protein
MFLCWPPVRSAGGGKYAMDGFVELKYGLVGAIDG